MEVKANSIIVIEIFESFVGSNEATTTAITAVTSTRADDRINSVFANPDSKDLPLVIASSIAKYVAEQANNSPAENYAGTLSQLNAGIVEWTLADKEDAKTQGVGFVRVVDGVVKIHEVVTMFDDSQYAEIAMPYRKVSDITRLQNTLYAFDLKLGTDFYKEAVLVSVGQIVATGIKAVSVKDIKLDIKIKYISKYNKLSYTECEDFVINCIANSIFISFRC